MSTLLLTTITDKPILYRFVYISALTMLLWLPAAAQTDDCPDVPGGYAEINLSVYAGSTFQLYPSALSGAASGTSHSTVGKLYSVASKGN